jgi:hypothetical protein
MRLAVLAIVVFALGACASVPQGDLGATHTSWEGAPYEEVVARWGAPARSTSLPDGREAHTWVSETVESRGALWPSIGIFGGSGGVGFGTGVTVAPGAGGALVRCERTFFFRDGRVVEQSWQGSSDYCAQFSRGS